jgi:hypothetical protein
LVPVKVKSTLPLRLLVDVVTVSVDEPVPAGTVVGEKAAVIPAGRSGALSITADAELVAMVYVATLPAVTFCVLEATAIIVCGCMYTQCFEYSIPTV